MTLLEKTINNDNNNALWIIILGFKWIIIMHYIFFLGRKRYLFCNKYVLATWVKNFKLHKTNSRPLSYQKTYTKRNPWAAIH